MNAQDDSAIIIRITPQMEQLWNKLGIDAKVRTDQVNQLQWKCDDIYENSIKDLNNQCSEVRKQIEQLQQKHKQAMAAYGIPEKEIYSSFKPIEDNNLLAQLSAAQKEYELFRVKITEQVQKIENFVLICKESFDALEVSTEERGEFAEVGETDFTRDRIERFRIKSEELQKEIKERQSQIKATKQRINKTTKQMSDYCDETLNKLIKKGDVGNSYIMALDECEKRATKEFETRAQQLRDYALDITNSWDTLNTPDEERKEFIKKFSDLSISTLEACKQEISSLKEKEMEMLPTLIEGKRDELSNLYSTLHISVESRSHFDKSAYDDKERLHEEYQFLSNEIIRLKKIIEACHPILIEIGKRESIIEDYEYVQSIQNDPHRLTSRGPGMAQQLMKEEKARKRYKFTLPNVEKKLEQLLLEYYKENNKHFEWDGHPYIEKLSIKQEATTQPEEIKAKSTKPKRVPLHVNQNVNPNTKSMSMRV